MPEARTYKVEVIVRVFDPVSGDEVRTTGEGMIHSVNASTETKVRESLATAFNKAAPRTVAMVVGMERGR